jgi:hypothetical protein
MLDEDLTHHTGCYPEKMSAVLPLRNVVSHQANVGFVDECCALESVVGPFALKVMARNLAKLGVDQWN